MFTAEPLHELVGILTSQFNRWAEVELLTPNIHTFKVKVILSVAPEAAVASAYEMTAAPFTLVRQSKTFPETADVNSETTVW